MQLKEKKVHISLLVSIMENRQQEMPSKHLDVEFENIDHEKIRQCSTIINLMKKLTLEILNMKKLDNNVPQ